MKILSGKFMNAVKKSFMLCTYFSFNKYHEITADKIVDKVNIEMPTLIAQIFNWDISTKYHISPKAKALRYYT